MNIYVDKLPSSCEYCPCNDDYYRCGLSGDLFDEHDIDTGRMKNCKLKKLDDVRENVRGAWLKGEYYSNGYKEEWIFPYCSICHYETDKMYKFCPNCGAEMGGDNK